MIILKLTDEQTVDVDNFYIRQETCQLCECEPAQGQRRALLAQPNSLKATVPHVLKVVALCMACFSAIDKVIHDLKEKVPA
jgi:hypothetical protein